MTNTVAKILKVCAIVLFIVSVISSFIVGRDKYGDFEISIASIYWFGGFFGALFMYAFGEVIELLDANYHTNRYIAEYLQKLQNDNVDEKKQTTYPQKHESKGYSLSEMAAKSSGGGWICTKCSTKNDAGAMSCKDCGTYRK